MKSITKSLLESLEIEDAALYGEDIEGKTLYDFMMEYCDGDIDEDVSDTDIDMEVAFSYCMRFNEDTYYDKFMLTMAKRTKITKVSYYRNHIMCLVCNFSEVLKPYNEQFKEFFNMENSEFHEDEAYYEAVANLEPLFSGFAGESTYKEFYEIIK
jgi:hypothetical protein